MMLEGVTSEGETLRGGREAISEGYNVGRGYV